MGYEDEKILLMAGATLVLAGCGEKGGFEKAINAKIGQIKNLFLTPKQRRHIPCSALQTTI